MNTSLPQVARITGIHDESAKVRTLVLDLHLEAEPGQFVMAWLPGVNEKPFSLVRAVPATLTIARVGSFTDAVWTLGIGDRLWVRGSLGRPFGLPEWHATGPKPPLLLIGGGYGVAPLYFLAERARAAGWPVVAVIGARTADDVVFPDHFAGLGAQVVVTTDDGSLGQRGLATDVAAQFLALTSVPDHGPAPQALYACGPEPMLEAVEALAHAHGLPAQLSYERTMRCAFGVCGSCARNGWLVCHDGPVRYIP